MTRLNSSAGLSLANFGVKPSTVSMEAPLSATYKFFWPTGVTDGPVGKANPAGLRRPYATICPSAQCEGIGGKTGGRIVGNTNRRICERPEEGSRALRSIFSRGPDPTSIPMAAPDAFVSRRIVCDENSGMMVNGRLFRN